MQKTRLEPNDVRPPRPLKGLGYGAILGTGAGAAAGFAGLLSDGLLKIALGASFFGETSEFVDHDFASLLLYSLFALFIGAVWGLLLGAIVGLIVGGFRFERSAPVGSAAAGAIIGGALTQFILLDGYDGSTRLAVGLVVGLLHGMIGFLAGLGLKRSIEAP